MNKKKNDINVLTAQLVSQLMYHSSRLSEEDHSPISSDILKLIDAYAKKIEKHETKIDWNNNPYTKY